LKGGRFQGGGGAKNHRRQIQEKKNDESKGNQSNPSLGVRIAKKKKKRRLLEQGTENCRASPSGHLGKRLRRGREYRENETAKGAKTLLEIRGSDWNPKEPRRHWENILAAKGGNPPHKLVQLGKEGCLKKAWKERSSEQLN